MILLPNCGVQNNILTFLSLPSEISKLHCAILKEVIDKFVLQIKIVILCADNTNINFDGSKRMCGFELKRKIIVFGYGAQIIHNCFQ